MKTSYIVYGILAAIVLLVIVSIISTSNRAVGLEQNIEQSQSGITVQLKRQHDLILQLVQVVQQASNYEAGVQKSIAELRSAAQSGDIENAQLVLRAIAEAYPQLQANQTYMQLMTEMSVSENLVTSYRISYNDDVKEYKRFTQRFPARMYLAISGHTVQDYEYLVFSETDTTLPTDLFEK